MSWRFDPLARADFPLLAGWLQQPHVQRWWADDPSPAALEADYGGCIDGSEPAQVFIASLGGRPLGLVQRYRIHAWPTYVAELEAVLELPADCASLDYLLGEPDRLRQGLGTSLVAAFTAQLFRDDPAASCILVPVHAQNRASWRLLERCGYRRIAACALAPDNPADSRDHFVYRIDPTP